MRSDRSAWMFVAGTAVLSNGRQDLVGLIAVETEEFRRTRWIRERGKVGESMAAVILDRVREQEPEAFAEAVQSVMQDFVVEVEREAT